MEYCLIPTVYRIGHTSYTIAQQGRLILGCWRQEAAFGEGRFEDSFDDRWQPTEVEWWSYAYIPSEYNRGKVEDGK